MAEYIEREALLENLKKQYGDELGWQHTVNMSDVGMMIEDAPAADVVSRGVFEQVKWERDIAMRQLEEHGIPFGGKADVVEVVRCKDCIYNKNGGCTHSEIYDDRNYNPNYYCSDGEKE